MMTTGTSCLMERRKVGMSKCGWRMRSSRYAAAASLSSDSRCRTSWKRFSTSLSEFSSFSLTSW